MKKVNGKTFFTYKKSASKYKNRRESKYEKLYIFWYLTTKWIEKQQLNAPLIAKNINYMYGKWDQLLIFLRHLRSVP